MENTQYSFDSGEHRLCNFFGKKGRARRQTRRARRKGGAEQAQENVDATEYVDQEEDTKVTVETLTEKRNKIQENRNVAVDKFESIKKKMETKGYNEAAEELNKFYQEEYLKQVAEHEGELDEAYAKHEEAQENPIYQKQITKQCGRCYYYRWIVVRRQKEMDEHERTLDGLLDKYNVVVNGLMRKLSLETDRVENEHYKVEKVTVTNVITGDERIETVDVQEETQKVVTTLDEKADLEVAAKNGDENAEVQLADRPSIEEMAEETAQANGNAAAEVIANNADSEVKHIFFEKLGKEGSEAKKLVEVAWRAECEHRE
ncbi:MAG: hypothetical protein QF741_03795 [Candidatus Peribacteraceae bacterium]|nr:hypothetical protein [Candidatus Peribacteraceae bacterium]